MSQDKSNKLFWPTGSIRAKNHYKPEMIGAIAFWDAKNDEKSDYSLKSSMLCGFCGGWLK